MPHLIRREPLGDGERTHIHLQLPEPMLNRLKAEAERDDRTVSSLTRVCIAEHFARLDAAQPREVA